jgi:hypothetical protein
VEVAPPLDRTDRETARSDWPRKRDARTGREGRACGDPASSGSPITSFRGAIRTRSNRVNQLGGDRDFDVVTGDRDPGDRCAYPEVAAGPWQAMRNARVYFTPRRPSGRRQQAIKGGAALDLLHVNSSFSPAYTIQPLLADLGRRPPLPTMIAPRGEFSPAAPHLR